MNKIQKTTNLLLIFFNFLLIALPLFYIILWLTIDTEFTKSLIAEGALLMSVVTPESVINLASINWTLKSKIIGFLSSITSKIPLLSSIILLKFVFVNYKTGRIFTVNNAKYYRFLGLLFFADALICKPLSGLLITLAATINNLPGHRYIAISAGTPNLEAIFCGIIVIVISWVMLEGTKIDEEHRLTV